MGLLSVASLPFYSRGKVMCLLEMRIRDERVSSNGGVILIGEIKIIGVGGGCPNGTSSTLNST
jgi:hypothetical protein